MANLSSLFGNEGFKPEEVEDVLLDFEPLPKGQYRVQIVESEVLPTKSGTGTNLTLKLVVQDGKFKNRVLFDNLCVVNENAKAQGISQTKLKQAIQSLGVKSLKDSSQLHNKDLMASIIVEKDDYKTKQQGNGEDVFRNNIRSYAPVKAAETVGADDFDEDAPF